MQEEFNLQDKEQVEVADRNRFAFVNEVVKDTEKRKVFTKQKNRQDRIDDVLTNKFIGIPVFAAIMFGVFYISQSTVGTWIADWLVGWIETFQALGGKHGRKRKPLPSGSPGGWNHWRCRCGGGIFAPGNGYVFPNCSFGGLRLHGPVKCNLGSDF